MPPKIIFATSTELVALPPAAVVCISADGNYSMIRTASGDTYTLTLQLGVIERRIASMIDESDNRFIRIGKSLIVNRDFIASVSITRQRLVLSDSRTFRHEETASREALKALKDFIEKEYRHD